LKLSKSNIKPPKISRYIERRDPEFKIKSATVLHTYKQVEVLREKADNGGDVLTAYISYDEKPGIQAIGNVSSDLSPVPGVYPSISRDYEYKRYGTLSLLAGIDLLTGEHYVKVFDRHRSKEFIESLKYFDELNQMPVVFKWKYKMDEIPGGVVSNVY
jgi:hypothetical protein